MVACENKKKSFQAVKNEKNGQVISTCGSFNSGRYSGDGE